jgi:glutaminyl-tRNA synthetase
VPSRPRQYEFGRLNPSYTVTSKRKLKQLVEERVVSGWDDPRMPTISGMRRRGYTPAAIRKFCDMVGTTRSDGVVDVAMLEFAIREDLNDNAMRGMCVLNPLKVVLTDYAPDAVAELRAPGHPNRIDLGERVLPFTRELYIDADDFREEANKKYKRLVLGKRVRLRNAYIIEADAVLRDEQGNIAEIHAHTIPNTLGEDPADGGKPKGVIHWVSASHGRNAEVRLYERLFNHEAPDKGDNAFMDHINPDSLAVVKKAWIEPSLAGALPEQVFQFEREGYFVADRYDHSKEKPVFNRTIGLRDTWNEG